MQRKRILLMHISNISGHRSASLAIEKAIKFRSHQTETLTINLFNYVHPQGEWIVNFLYMLMIQRFPFVWGHLYDNPYWVKKTRRMKAMIHRQNLPKLESLFNNFRPDLAVSTQAFPCGMVADYKRIKGVNFPLIAVLTDFVPHWYWIYDTIDYYVAPSEEVKEKLITKGISSNRIKALGIPFDPKFNINLNKTELRKKLNLNEKLFTVLIMGGGQGLGPIKEVIKEIDNLEFPLQAIVVCGSNRRIYGWLKKRLKYYKKDIHLLGYAQNIEELMSVADIIITKPGGITCAEALSKGLPILVIAPIPGQEANNTDYLTKQGAAIEVKTPRDLIDIIGDLYRKPNKLKNLSEACLRIAKPNAAGDIAELLLNL